MCFIYLERVTQGWPEEEPTTGGGGCQGFPLWAGLSRPSAEALSLASLLFSLWLQQELMATGELTPSLQTGHPGSIQCSWPLAYSAAATQVENTEPCSASFPGEALFLKVTLGSSEGGAMCLCL